MFYKYILQYLAIVSLVSNLNAQEVYTVDQLLLKAVENSPSLHISKLQYNASQSRYDAAFSGYLPTVNLNASTGRSYQDGTYNLPSVAGNLLVGALSLKQIIYDFGKTSGTSDSQKFAAESYNMSDLQNISDTKRDVKTAYYNVLKAAALINVQKENVKLNKAQLYRAQKYFEAGIRTKIDVSDANVRLIQAKLNLRTAQYDLKSAYAQLDKVVGFQALKQDYRVYENRLNLNSLYESLYQYKFTLEESIRFAYEHRYEIKKEHFLIQSSQANVTTVASEYYPSLYFGANYTYQHTPSSTLELYVPQNQWSANLNLDWNLYEGGSTNARKEEQVINTNISNLTLQETKLNIKNSTTNAFINVNKTKDTVELAQSLVKFSNEKFNQASKRYENGLSDYIELQEARQGYIDAKATLIVDYYEYYIAIAQLDNAIGR